MKSRPKVYISGQNNEQVTRIVMRKPEVGKSVSPSRKPMVYMGGGGISARKVLASGGIGVGMVRGMGKAAKIVKPRFAVMPPKDKEPEDKNTKSVVQATSETSKGITEREEVLVEYMAASEAVRAKCEEQAGETKEPNVVLPELPMGAEESGAMEKKRKGKGKKLGGKRRKSKKGTESTEVAESERAAIQAELEAASDAAGEMV